MSGIRLKRAVSVQNARAHYHCLHYEKRVVIINPVSYSMSNLNEIQINQTIQATNNKTFNNTSSCQCFGSFFWLVKIELFVLLRRYNVIYWPIYFSTLYCASTQPLPAQLLRMLQSISYRSRLNHLLVLGQNFIKQTTLYTLCSLHII